MNQFDRETLNQVTAAYQRAVDELEQLIRSYAGDDGNLRLESLQQLLNQSQQRLGQLNRARDLLLEQGLEAGARLGVQPFAGDIADGILTRAADEAVQFTNNFIAADGLQLSDRIWRINNHASEVVSGAINNAVIQGRSASQAANDFLSRGEPVPADVATKMNMANADGVARVVGRDLMASGGPRDNALRLFRTEINRAHGEAYMATGEDHPEFAGWKFLLSPRHPETDICDMHARANLHGLGPGIYPSRQRCPWPAHPNTLSYTEIVFSDEISDEDRAGKTTRIDWLKDQPPGVQQSVLNSRKKAAALREGILRENEIATPWQVLKGRYQRRGIDVDQLGANLPANAVAPGPARPTGTPVSVALEARGYKSVTANVLDTIDRLHGDGDLPRIPVKRSTSKSANGRYMYIYNRYTGEIVRADSIQIMQQGGHKDLTLAHEIGHFIDQQGLPGNGYSSVSHPVMSRWRKAVNDSEAVKQLRTLLDGPDTITQGSRLYGVSKNHVRYLLDEFEIWARSYAQYVATRGGNSVLKSQLDVVIGQRNNAVIDYAYQWQHDDFEPIADAIDDVFKKMGWLSG